MREEAEEFAKELTALESKYVTMFGYWKRFKKLPWEWGLTREPCIEHLRALEAMDTMVRDADRMYKEMGKDQDQEQQQQQQRRLPRAKR